RPPTVRDGARAGHPRRSPRRVVDSRRDPGRAPPHGGDLRARWRRMSTARVALATCAVLPRLDPDDAPLVGALAARGIEASPVVWDDASVDWSGFDTVIVRSTWDCTARRDEFVAWAQRVPRLVNTAP